MTFKIEYKEPIVKKEKGNYASEFLGGGGRDGKQAWSPRGWLVLGTGGLSRIVVSASSREGDDNQLGLPPALSLGGQATAWECSPGRSLCLTKSSACGRLWQFAQPWPLSLLHLGEVSRCNTELPCITG